MDDIDAGTHRRIWEALPWIANGSASADQHREVDTHLHDCADCRDELALQRQIHAAMNDERAGGDGTANLARLFTRIDSPLNPQGLDRYDGIDDEPTSSTSPERRARHVGWRIAAAALFVAQSVGLIVMAYALLQPAPEANYRTLSNAEPVSTTATIRFVPAPDLSVQALQALLDEAGLRIVDSRARAAIYGLAPTGDDRSAAATAQAIARLRGQPGVLLVEPIAGPATPSAR